MKLQIGSIQWALNHINFLCDTDLFPRLREIDAIISNPQKVIDYLSNIDIGAYCWRDSRRFIIPKAEYSYRIATQLHPLDNIMFAAIIYEFGDKIEACRIPVQDNRVFNYRFSPGVGGTLYNNNIGWDQFWYTCSEKCNSYPYVIYLDISDFYNQIYHHTIEQQLIVCGVEREVIKSVVNFLSNITQKVSRGIPIGPHSVHLLAELSLIPIDQSLLNRGIDFCRFSDDIVLFAKDRFEAKYIIYKMAEILDKQQRLVIQNQKTRIFTKEEFINYAKSMVENYPVNKDEQEIIDTLKRHNSNPYASVSYLSLTASERELFSKGKIEGIISEMINKETIDFTKLRWFIRRLAQVGCDGAVEMILSEYEKILPAINDIILYFLSVANVRESNLHDVGQRLVDLLDKKVIQSNEFFQISILSLFGSTKKFNHVHRLISFYDSSSESIKREVIFAAMSANASAWIRELKENYPLMNSWCKRAYLMAVSTLPSDEKEVILKKIIRPVLSKDEIIEISLIEWALSL